MKNFWKNNSYYILKMAGTQIALSLFALMLSAASSKAESNALAAVTGVFSIIFYLFLIYAVCWEAGAKDKIRIDAGHMKKNRFLGAFMSLASNSVNIILAVIYLCAYPFISAEVEVGANNVAAVVTVADKLLNGMYAEFLALPVGSGRIGDFPWAYFVIIIPAIVVSEAAYLLGLHDKHFTNILIPKTTKEKRKENK